MKYWIFQNNQVLGPYGPDDLGHHAAFSAESLVCPEGKRGTSMGDWQRAGMVPDLSVALIRAAQAQGSRTAVATLEGLPPEPTLKDLAVLGSLQEKMARMEDVIIQLQEGLRVKDAEVAALHQDLVGKAGEATQIKQEAESRRREAETLKAEAAEFKRKVAELEERVGAVNRLSETISKAVEAEKHVEHDVETQGAALADLTKELEALRAQMLERPAPAPAPATAPEPSAAHLPPPAQPMWTPPSAERPAPGMTVEIPGQGTTAPLPSSSAPATPEGALPSSAPLPAFDAGALPAFGLSTPANENPIPAPAFDPMASHAETPSPLEGVSLTGIEPAAAEAPAPAKSNRKKALLIGAAGGLLALAALAVFSGRLTQKKPVVAVDTAPVSAPAPMPAAAPEPDPRQVAIDATRDWALPDGRSLGMALETLSPPSGNLSPWMAEPLPNGRALVNYFAHGAAGAPTLAYEFEVDLAARSVAGRNAAAKAVLTGKAAAPPAPAKAKPVKVKTKAKKKAAAESKPFVPLPGDDGSAGAVPMPAPVTATPLPGAPAAASPDAPDDTPAGPATAPAAEPAKPAKRTAAKRAAKASAAAKPKAADKAADEALLDDVLKE
jgi:hypothetical protein